MLPYLCLCLFILLSSASTIKVEGEDVEATVPRYWKTHNHPQQLRPDSRKPIRLTVGLSKSLSEKAFEIAGDSSFTRRLQVQEESEARQIKGKQRTSDSGSAKTSPFLRGGMVLLAIGSLVWNGSLNTFKDMLLSSASALAIAWLPALLLQSSWIEIGSIIALVLRPPVRLFLQAEVFPTMRVTVQKMVLTEVWRRIWTAVLAPLPKPLFVPDAKQEYARLPSWIRQKLGQWNEMTDRFTQGLLRRSIQQNIHGSIDTFFESVTNSILEISIIYDESKTDGSSTAEDLDLKVSSQVVLAEGEDYRSGSDEDLYDVPGSD